MQQIRFAKLIKHDPIYRKWLSKPPGLTAHIAFDPWRIYVQKKDGGKWAYKDYADWAEAYRTLGQLLPNAHDLALNCRRQAYLPPKVKWKLDGVKRTIFVPMPMDHHWCPFCRRPTIFTKMRRHALRPQYRLGEPESMCTICGVRLEFARSEIKKDIRSPLEWPMEVKVKN